MKLKMKLNWRNAVFLIGAALAVLPATLRAQTRQKIPPANPPLYTEDFLNGKLTGWNTYGASVSLGSVNGRPALQTQGDSQVFWGDINDQKKTYRDVTVEGDVSVDRDNVNSGFMVRASKQTSDNSWGGYWASIRKLDVGYAVVQLFRFPEHTLLQEARVKVVVRENSLVHLKITCKGPNLWVWANGTDAPAITEFDDRQMQPGFIGFKAENNKASLSHVKIGPAGQTPHAPYVHDWSWVKGAVFITSESVNSNQMWDEYHPAVISA